MQSSNRGSNGSMEAPWEASAEQLHEQLRAVLPCDAFALAAVALSSPGLDELIALRGWAPAQLGRWFSAELGQDRLVKAALRQGDAVSAPDKPATDLAGLAGQHVMLHILPESFADRRWWLLLATRKARPFSALEQSTAALLLRQWQCAFLQPDESQKAQLLLGHDRRLLLADLSVQRRLLKQPGLVAELVEGLFPVVEQRYPSLKDDQTEDMALALQGQVTWVRFRRSRAVQSAAAEHWFIELRPLEKDELMPIGVVKDERVARAIAYLHEHFHESPSLAQVSRYVHMSPFHFHRLFSKQVSISPKQYLQRKQLQVAKWMLRAGRAPISSIAEQAGFSSHGHFTSTFHRLVGVSPSEYREKN